jgi:hypothetical protein
MTQPLQTFSTNDQVGIREDLVDVIYDVSPVETPFLSLAAHVKATNTNHEWQTDVLTAAATNYVIEGDEATHDASTATVRRGNYTQISDKVAVVSGTARKVTTAGRADEMDYQMLKRARELKRDLEFALLDNNAKVGGNDTTARECAGVPVWIVTNIDHNGATPPAGAGADAWAGGTARAFTEDQLKTVMALIWDQGGEPGHLFVNSYNRQVASTFGAGTKFQKVEDKTLHSTFDIYEGDFSTLKIVPDRYMETAANLGHALVLDMDYWKVAFMPGRNMATWDLAKVGDVDRKQILCEFTLEACNQRSSGIVMNLTLS